MHKTHILIVIIIFSFLSVELSYSMEKIEQKKDIDLKYIDTISLNTVSANINIDITKENKLKLRLVGGSGNRF